MKKKLVVLAGSVLGFAPVVALAQAGQITSGVSTPAACNGGFIAGGIGDTLCTISRILNALIPILIALGVVFFVYGVITYVISSDEEAKKAGRNRIIYGVIGLAVIIGVWGLVHILTTTFGLNGPQNFTLPTI